MTQKRKIEKLGLFVTQSIVWNRVYENFLLTALKKNITVALNPAIAMAFLIHANFDRFDEKAQAENILGIVTSTLPHQNA